MLSSESSVTIAPGEVSGSWFSSKVSSVSRGGGDVRGDDGGVGSSAVTARGGGGDDEHVERGDEYETSNSCAGTSGGSLVFSALSTISTLGSHSDERL